jgi:hypothetical protein
MQAFLSGSANWTRTSLSQTEALTSRLGQCKSDRASLTGVHD